MDFVTCASPKYLARHGTPAKPEDLKDHNCLLHTLFTPREWPFRSGAREKLVRVDGSFRSNNPEVLAQLALGGIGVTRLPAYIVRDYIKDGRLVSLFDGQAKSRQIMRIYYPSHDNLPEKTKIFLRFLAVNYKPSRKL
jgi:DNA-binding transcriptional LysR family regulator